MRLGIFGGTFDPVHLGHLILAETCREECELDEVWFMPAYVNPFKQGRSGTPAKFRIEMLRFALAGHANFRISTLEAGRTEPSYTVETLRKVRTERPDDELYLLIGGDSLRDFPQWREPEAIVQMATLVAVNRGQSSPSLAKFIDALGEWAAERVKMVNMPAIDLSATDIRDRVAQGRSIRYRTPRPVELYILQNRLYVPES